MEILNNYEWRDSVMFLLLILIAVHILWKFFYGIKPNSTIIFSNISLLSKSKSLKRKLIHLPYLLTIISAILIIISLARPQTHNNLVTTESEGIDIILAMDVSGSMKQEDLKPNRLEGAKEVAIDFVKKRGNDRIGVVMFSGRATSSCPLTNDHHSVINLINKLTFDMMPEGTHIGDGLGVAINRLTHSNGKSKVIILLTDGNDDGEGKYSPIKSAKLAASDTAKVKIYTIGVGKPQMLQGWIQTQRGPVFLDKPMLFDDIDSISLKKIARITGGKYFRANNNKGLEKIYEEIDNLETSAVEVVEEFISEEKFYRFTEISLFLLIASIILQFSYFKRAI